MKNSEIVNAFKTIVGIEQATLFAVSLNKSVNELTGVDIRRRLGREAYRSLVTYAEARAKKMRQIKRKGGRP